VSAHDLGDTGGYNLGIEGLLPPGPVNATLVKGSLVSSTVAAPGQVDVYDFVGQAGQTILVTLAETAGFSGSVSAARVTILAPSGAQLAAFISNGQQRVVLTETGTYTFYVSAHDLGDTGGYNLGIEGLLPPGPVNAALSCGSLAPAVITSVAQVEIFTFAGLAGQLVTLTLAETAGFSGSVSAARVTLLAPSGAQAAAFISNGQQQITLPESGTYTIYVNANDYGALGSVNLGLTCQ
jgi:hypothetical protein